LRHGRGRGTRTPDLRFWRPSLYQLSYTPSRRQISADRRQKASLPTGSSPPMPRRRETGAGEGNRTLVISLEGCCSTIELHPRRQGEDTFSQPNATVPEASVGFVRWWERQDSNLRR